eukprot:scaffold6586_cov34-Tisochrysis_lutea.AAC.4
MRNRRMPPLLRLNGFNPLRQERGRMSRTMVALTSPKVIVAGSCYTGTFVMLILYSFLLLWVGA